MKITGRRILVQILSCDYYDYKPSMWCNKQNNATKRWSKKGRSFVRKETNKELLEYNISKSAQQ